MYGASPCVEARHAVAVAGDRLTIDDAGLRAYPCQSFHDQREAVREVIAGAAVEPHAVAVLAGDDAEAVVLDLVQPSLTGWRLLRFVGRQGGTKPAGNRMYIAA